MAPLYMILWGLVLLTQFTLIELLRRLVKKNNIHAYSSNLDKDFPPEQAARGISNEPLRLANTSMLIFLGGASLWGIRTQSFNVKLILCICVIISAAFLLNGYFRFLKLRSVSTPQLMLEEVNHRLKNRTLSLQQLLEMSSYASLGLATIGPWILTISILMSS